MSPRTLLTGSRALGKEQSHPKYNTLPIHQTSASRLLGMQRRLVREPLSARLSANQTTCTIPTLVGRWEKETAFKNLKSANARARQHRQTIARKVHGRGHTVPTACPAARARNLRETADCAEVQSEVHHGAMSTTVNDKLKSRTALLGPSIRTPSLACATQRANALARTKPQKFE